MGLSARIAALVTAASLVVVSAACGSTATEDSETPEPAAEASAAEPPAEEATDAEGATDLKAALVQAVVNPFYSSWPSAIEAASRDFGISAEIASPQDFDQVQQNQVIDSLIAKGVNGIVIQNVDATAGGQTIKRLVDQGVTVVGGVSCADQEGTGSSLCLEVGLEDSIYQATMLLCEELGGEGNIVHLDGQLADKNTAARIRGVDKALAECPGLKLQQRITDIDSAEAAQNAVSSLLAASGSEVNGIVSGAYNPSVAVASEFTSRQESEIKAVLVDTDPVVLDAVKNGYVLATRAANAFEAAYLGLLSVQLLRSGCTYEGPFVIPIPYVTVAAADVDALESKLESIAIEAGKTWEQEYFSCPS